MSTQEISSAIIRRVQIERYALGTYDSSSSYYRVEQIKKDIIDVFSEFDYKHSGEARKSFPTYGTGTKIVAVDKVENSKKKIRFHVSVYSDTITYYDLERYRFLLREISATFGVTKSRTPWLNVFLLANYEAITMKTIKKNNQSMFQTLTKLDGSTLYYGLGDVDYRDRQISKKIRSASNLLPEFIIMRIRSKDDIRTRLSIIFDFINEKADIFETILNSQSKT